VPPFIRAIKVGDCVKTANNGTIEVWQRLLACVTVVPP